jgi:hypothetical protein
VNSHSLGCSFGYFVEFTMAMADLILMIICSQPNVHPGLWLPFRSLSL